MTDFNTIFVDENSTNTSLSTEQEDNGLDRERDADRDDEDDLDALAADIAERVALDEEEVRAVLRFLATDGESADPKGPAGVSHEARSRQSFRETAREWAARIDPRGERRRQLSKEGPASEKPAWKRRAELRQARQPDVNVNIDRDEAEEWAENIGEGE